LTFDGNNLFARFKLFFDPSFSVPPEKSQGTGIHWQVAQSTSLMNIVFEMSTAPNTAHQGIWMEDGSGGFMGDMVFNGGKLLQAGRSAVIGLTGTRTSGKFGIWAGNQQYVPQTIARNRCLPLTRFTVRNVTINNAQTAIFSLWNWGMVTVAILSVFVLTHCRMDIPGCQNQQLSGNKLS